MIFSVTCGFGSCCRGSGFDVVVGSDSITLGTGATTCGVCCITLGSNARGNDDCTVNCVGSMVGSNGAFGAGTLRFSNCAIV